VFADGHQAEVSGDVSGDEATEALLVRFDDTRLQQVFVKPGIDLSRYSKMLIQPAGFDYKDVPEVRNPDRRSTSRTAYPLTESQRREFESSVDKVFSKEFLKSKHFVEVAEPGPDVLLVRGALSDIVSYVPPERATRDTVLLSVIGQATLLLELRDSESQELLASAADRRSVEPNRVSINVNSRPINKAQTERVLKRWAQILVRGLDELHENGPLEPAE